MEHFWQVVTPDLTGSDLVAILLFYGNKVHCKLEGGTPAFESINEVYKLIVENKDDPSIEKVVTDFQATQDYDQIMKAGESLKKKSP
jgi:hypothetical protein